MELCLEAPGMIHQGPEDSVEKASSILAAAYDLAIHFGVQRPEPGPYIIVEVWRRTTDARVSPAARRCGPTS